MGSTFSNISVYKATPDYSKEYVRERLINLMQQRGYALVDNDVTSDISFVIRDNPLSRWISLYSDAFDGDHDELNIYGTSISTLLESPVLCVSCIDSDFLLLQLTDASKDLVAYSNIGHLYDDIPIPRASYSKWDSYSVAIPRKGSFKEICKQNYEFAEDALVPLGKFLGFQPQDINFMYDELEYDSSLEKIGFKISAEKTEAEHVELVDIQIMNYNLFPPFIDKPSTVQCTNGGGTSKGLYVLFVGDYVKDERITFSSVELVHYDYKNKKKRNEMITIQLDLKKIQLEDGSYAYLADCPEFEIPEKVSSGLQGKKLYDEKNAKSFFVRFKPHGDEKFILDITVVIIPKLRFENQVVWNVWAPFGSKEAFIDDFNVRFSRFPQPNIRLDKDFYL